MEFILAKTAGFCWGVRLALNKTLEVEASQYQKVTTLGPLVHNPQVVDLLRHREIHNAGAIQEIDGGLAIIRSHGVSPADYAELERRSDAILDNTCPIVKRSQKVVQTYVKKGHFVVIYGEPRHAEVIGLIGFAGADNVRIIEGAHELDKIPADRNVLLITQTTTNVAEWQRIMKEARERFPSVVVKDTMCDATVERQDEILELCRSVDAMVVIGGKNSGNTTRLAQIASEEFRLPTWHIETEDELAGVDFTPYSRVGVTAGASTPSWSIDRVMAYLKTLEDQSRAPVLSKAKRVLEALVVTSAYTSIAAGVLCYVAALLQGIPFRLSSFALVFCYVLAMHVLNRFTERNLDRFRDDPVRARFYEKNKRFMQALGVGSALAAVAVGFYMGVLPFLLVLAASILGILYSVKIVPKRVTKYVGFRRLKDIAASKNFFVASAWAVVSVFPLFFLTENAGLGQTLLTFFFLFLVTGIRSVVVDLTDMNADRLVGRETIPLVFGEKKTKQALLYGCAALGVLLIAVAGVGIFPPFAWILGLVVLAETIFFHYRGFSFDRVSVVRRDFLVDTHFLAAGLVALEWTLFV